MKVYLLRYLDCNEGTPIFLRVFESLEKAKKAARKEIKEEHCNDPIILENRDDLDKNVATADSNIWVWEEATDLYSSFYNTFVGSYSLCNYNEKSEELHEADILYMEIFEKEIE